MKSIILSFCLLPAALIATAETAPAPDAWRLAARFDFNAAAEALRDTHDSSPAYALAAATALLGEQPRAAEKIRRALAQTRGLLARADLDAETRIAARFLEARIVDLHLEPRDPATARELYSALLASHPGHALAEQAAVPLALSLLHDARDASREQRLADAEAVLAGLTLPEPARDLRFAIGHTRLRWDLDRAQARAQLLAAAETGFSQAQRQASLWFTLGQLADEDHDTVLASRAYGQFLALARRDTRAAFVHARLAALVPTDVSVTQNQPR